MCSGQHSVYLLLARLKGWDPQNYWTDEHPAQQAYRTAVARAYDTPPARLRPRSTAAACRPTPSRFARWPARSRLADPAAIPPRIHAASLAPALLRIRDAMLANPEMVGGRHDRLDTSLMKAAPDRLVSKSGMEALRGVAILPGPASASTTRRRRVAVKIEDGDGFDRGTWAASVEALRQAGALDDRRCAFWPTTARHDPHGRLGAEAIPEFELAPIGELSR